METEEDIVESDDEINKDLKEAEMEEKAAVETEGQIEESS